MDKIGHFMCWVVVDGLQRRLLQSLCIVVSTTQIFGRNVVQHESPGFRLRRMMPEELWKARLPLPSSPRSSSLQQYSITDMR